MFCEQGFHCASPRLAPTTDILLWRLYAAPNVIFKITVLTVAGSYTYWHDLLRRFPSRNMAPVSYHTSKR
jgi:hypothetical protein